jgi:Fem-1 family protein b
MMESDCKCIDEFDNLLLAAVRQGNVDSVEKYLSTVINPDIYINRIYDEEYMQKCTLLSIACLNEHEDIMRLFLHRYKPDLEILNNILFGDENKSQQMCLNVTILWIATAINNFQMVKLLVEHGANVNHTTKTNSTPLRSICYNGNVIMARYLIENGADIHIAKENNDTNLAVSVYRKHLKMAVYLVNELGCDVNLCDNDGRSPLYDAVNCGSLEMVQFLLNQGARNFRAVHDQMSPLMWAAEKKRTDLVDAISSRCSLLEQIEAKELLASAFVVNDRDLEKSFEYFTQALELRSIHNLPKLLKSTAKEIFDNREECQTVDQLKELQSNSNNIYIEALLVRERLLGPMNVEYQHSLRYHGAILADEHNHQKAIAFWMYELGLRREYSIAIDSEYLRHFASMFSEMVYISSSISIETLLTIITVTIEELKRNTTDFDSNLHTLLFLITITSQVLLFFFEFFKMKISFLAVGRRKYVRYRSQGSISTSSFNQSTKIYYTF